MIDLVFETGKPKLGYEEPETSADGNIVWLRTSKVPLLDAQGKIKGVLGTYENITERKRAEVALKESEEKFRLLAENSPNMIFINNHGRVVYANKRCEEMMGYTREEFYSRDFNFITTTAPEYINLVNTKYAQHMTGKEVAPYEYALITKDGKRIETIINTRLIDFEGESAILGIITDITERKHAEEAL